MFLERNIFLKKAVKSETGKKKRKKKKKNWGK